MMANTLGVGIIGCGNISSAYFALAPLFRGIEVRACADIKPAAARARAREYDVRAESVDALLSAGDIDIIVNLTVPAAHYAVSKQAVGAGKHVYSEKPFVLSLAQGRDLARLAARRKVRIGSAPDTFLGGAHQQVRSLIDAGRVGRITSGTCHVMSHGMEHWHPDPDFFFKPGAGPVLDVGPYYVTNLLQLLGPVASVVARSATPAKHRTITSRPRKGRKIRVETPTTVHAILEFESGAIITLGASWDVWHHGHHNMELYGDKGTIEVPDPNYFGGDVHVTKGDKPVLRLPAWDHPFAVANQEHPRGSRANYRSTGLADMADAILKDRPHRCSMELALHAVDVMTSILKSGETSRPVRLRTTCERPAPLKPAQARSLLARKGR
jgi:predicted dehydrogenase